MNNGNSAVAPALQRTSGMAALCLLASFTFLPVSATADSLQALSVAPGYQVRSLELGVPFGGAMAFSPHNPHLLYVSAGNYGTHTIMAVNADTGTTRTVSGQIGNIGGLAVLENGDLAITENLTSETILRARDVNADGAFFDDGEISELIAPIQVDGSFTGAQMAVAPVNNAAHIPAGALIVQTADGGTSAELLVIRDPETSPAYFPPGEAWYSGFTFNGGIAFNSKGDLLCGISEFPFGRVNALVNANANNRIDPGEAHEILAGDVLVNSLSDLAVTGDDKLVATENSGSVSLFDLPGDLETGTISTSGVLVETNGTYLSSARADFPHLAFTPGAQWPVSTIYIGGYVSFPAATNLLAITPIVAPAGAKDWELFQ